MGFPFRGPDPTSDDGVVNRGFLKTFLGWAGATDWAGQLTALLTPPSQAGIATETQIGATQLATLAEALAGTSATKALSALQHANISVASDVTDLSQKAATLPPGSIIALASGSYAGAGQVPSGTLARSLWSISGGKASPITPLIATPNTWVLHTSGLRSVLSQPNILLEPGVTKVLVGKEEYVWIGATTGFYPWSGVNLIGASWEAGISENSPAGSIFQARGDWVDVSLQGVLTSGTVAQFAPVAKMPTLGPTVNQIQMLTGGVGTWSTANFYTDFGGNQVRLISGSIPATAQFSVAGSYRRLVPTA